MDCGGSLLAAVVLDEGHLTLYPHASTARQFKGMEEAVFAPGRLSQLPLVVPPQGQVLLDLRLHVPPAALPGQRLTLDLVQRSRDGKRILGGLSVDITVSGDA